MYGIGEYLERFVRSQKNEQVDLVFGFASLVQQEWSAIDIRGLFGPLKLTRQLPDGPLLQIGETFDDGTVFCLPGLCTLTASSGLVYQAGEAGCE